MEKPYNTFNLVKYKYFCKQCIIYELCTTDGKKVAYLLNFQCVDHSWSWFLTLGEVVSLS